MPLAEIAAAVATLHIGRPVIVVDDESRENGGDIIMAAQDATPEWLGWIMRVTSGRMCAPMTNERADALQLPLMTKDNKDSLLTAYTVSVNADGQSSTGISASESARTLRALAAPLTSPSDLIRPGHILPLRAADGGVLQRPGHTEAAVELLNLAGLTPVGLIAEVVADDGEIMRLPELLRFGREQGIPVTSIEQLTRVVWSLSSRLTK